ncbi:MAG: hypothetical protein ABIH67_00565 [Candidatus Uhrbacteria bacterium]
MSVEDIKQHIADKALTEANKIRNESNIQVEALQLEWQKKIEDERQRLVSEIEHQASSRLAQAKFKIREQVNSKKMTAKQDQLDECYEKALQSLAELSDSEYQKLVKRLKESTKGLEGKIIEKENNGGFVFQTEEADLDFTFSTLLKQVRQQTLVEVNDILFN